MQGRAQSGVVVLAVLALGGGLLGLAAKVHEADASGFTLTIEPAAGPTRTLRVLDLDPVQARRRAPSLPAQARWTTWLAVDGGLEGELQVTARAPTRVLVDDALLLDHDGRPRRLTAPVRLTGGTHRVVVEQALGAPDPELRVAIVGSAAEPRRLETMPVFVDPPGPSALRFYAAAPLAGLAALAAAAGLLGFAARSLRRMETDSRRRRLRLAAHAAAALLTLYAAALRVHALAAKYEETAPAWMVRAVPIIRLLHPRGMRWVPPENPYDGDPYSYLRCAREMRWFYGPSGREPVFVFATRMALLALNDRDIAVNVASTVFSTLLVPATYALGLVAFSPGVALAAAAGMAVERQVIALGVEGWRDDAFAVFVVLSAFVLLRLRERPSRGRAAVAGVIFAGACLTRITSLSFLLPGLVLIAAFGPSPRRERRRAAATAAAIAGVLVAPFLVSCAIEYGDPLHAINTHTRFYRSRASGADEAETSVAAMLVEGRGPFALLDTAVVGLTSYPFANKWEHFDYWAAWLGPLLAALSIAGLLLWILHPVGRLLLAVVLASLLPYAFTWEIPGGSEWRFTLHAYPFYLLAAASAPGLLALATRKTRAASPRPRLIGATAAVLGLTCLYLGLTGLAYLRVREEIGAGRSARVAVGWRDLGFFADGWSPPRRQGNVLVRQAGATPAAVRIPLGSGPYTLSLRADPVGETARVAAALDGVPLGEMSLTRADRRIGSYTLAIPIAVNAPRRRPSRLTLRSQDGTAFTVWLLRIDPTGSLP